MESKQTPAVYRSFRSYQKKGRWFSTWYQLSEILRCDPKSVLEVGVGSHIVEAYLEYNTDIAYTSVDIKEKKKPDIVADVASIPVPDKSYDLVCAFQILEHISYEKVPVAIVELRRIARKHIVVSLPHVGRNFFLHTKLPFIPEIDWRWIYNWFPPENRYDGQHYWELGRRGFAPAKVVADFEAQGLKLTRDFRPFEKHNHHFLTFEVIEK